MLRILVPLLAILSVAIACSDADYSALREVEVGCRGDQAERSVAEVVAKDMLARESDELFVDEQDYGDLVDELETAFGDIVEEYPALAHIEARPDHVPGRLLIGVEGGLQDDIAGTGVNLSDAGPVDFVTGNTEFDALNARLGLTGIVPPALFNDASGVLLLCFPSTLNDPRAAQEFAGISGVRYAETNGFGGDGPDVDAARIGGQLFVVFREASGDCWVGCISEELSYFSYDEGQVTALPTDQAIEDETFEELTRLVRHRPPGDPASK